MGHSSGMHCAMRLFLLVVVACLCAALEPKCNVSYEPGQTIYEVPNSEASDCQHEWKNDSDFVLANFKDNDPMVLKNTLTTLVTTCLEVVHYQRDCGSEGVPYKCTCFANCSYALEKNNIKASPRNRMVIYFILVGCLILIALVLITAALRRRCNNQKSATTTL